MSEVAAEITPVVTDTSPAPEAIPETPAQEIAPEVVTPEGPTEVQIYQDVEAKFNADNSYDMTTEEVKAYLSVSDQINGGDLDKPEPKLLEEEKPPAEEKTAEEKPPETENKEEIPTEPNEEKPSGDSVSDSMYDSMKLVGAKDVTELAGKIKGLIDNRDSSGSRLGSENADLRNKAANHVQWIQDLKDGKPAAIAYLHNEIGYNSNKVVSPASATPDAPVGDFGKDEDFLDEQLAPHVRGLKEANAKLMEKVEKLEQRDIQRNDEVLADRANASWSDDVVNLVTSPENQKFYGLTANEARGLAEQYFDKSRSHEPIHPKFQKVHELIVFGHKQNLPTLKAAHLIKQHENGAFAQQIVDATKSGQKTYTPSQNSEMSEQQSRQGNTIPQAGISEEAVTKMERGGFDDIPDSWMDKDGTLLRDQIPQRFHEKIFG